MMMAKYELDFDTSSSAVKSQALEQFVNSKFQIILALQIFGKRGQGKQRRAVRALLEDHPYVEIVYDYDIAADVADRTKMKADFQRSAAIFPSFL